MRTELSPREYQSIMEMSCNVLTSLSQDEDFSGLLREYERRQYDETLSSEIRETFLNFRSFFEFLIIERDLLLEAGLSEATVQDILVQIRKVRLDAAAFKLDAEDLLTDLRRLAEEICSASRHVSDEVEDAEMMCNVWRITPFVFGAVSVAVDGVVYLYSPLKIPEFVRGASIAAGSVLLAVPGVMPQC